MGAVLLTLTQGTGTGPQELCGRGHAGPRFTQHIRAAQPLLRGPDAVHHRSCRRPARDPAASSVVPRSHASPFALLVGLATTRSLDVVETAADHHADDVDVGFATDLSEWRSGAVF